jgi:hypothetical protein
MNYRFFILDVVIMIILQGMPAPENGFQNIQTVDVGKPDAHNPHLELLLFEQALPFFSGFGYKNVNPFSSRNMRRVSSTDCSLLITRILVILILLMSLISPAWCAMSIINELYDALFNTGMKSRYGIIKTRMRIEQIVSGLMRLTFP